MRVRLLQSTEIAALLANNSARQVTNARYASSISILAGVGANNGELARAGVCPVASSRKTHKRSGARQLVGRWLTGKLTSWLDR